MAIARNYEGAPVSIAVMSVALVVAISLHLALLAGWQQDPGHVMESRFYEEGGVSVDFGPWEPWRLPTAGREVAVRCDVDRLGRIRDCQWVRESQPGDGETALKLMGFWDGRAAPALRGRKNVEFLVCVGYCPVP